MIIIENSFSPLENKNGNNLIGERTSFKLTDIQVNGNYYFIKNVLDDRKMDITL